LLWTEPFGWDLKEKLSVSVEWYVKELDIVVINRSGRRELTRSVGIIVTW
jgi:hypothetical protein